MTQLREGAQCDRPCFYSWPPLRRVQSTGARYTVVDLEPHDIPRRIDPVVPGVRWFRYHYLPEGA